MRTRWAFVLQFGFADLEMISSESFGLISNAFWRLPALTVLLVHHTAFALCCFFSPRVIHFLFFSSDSTGDSTGTKTWKEESREFSEEHGLEFFFPRPFQPRAPEAPSAECLGGVGDTLTTSFILSLSLSFLSCRDDKPSPPSVRRLEPSCRDNKPPPLSA